MGPDPFSGGLARALIDGRLAYVDRRLRVRLRTRDDYGEPFAGRAGRRLHRLCRDEGRRRRAQCDDRRSLGHDRSAWREIVPVTLLPAELAARRR